MLDTVSCEVVRGICPSTLTSYDPSTDNQEENDDRYKAHDCKVAWHGCSLQTLMLSRNKLRIKGSGQRQHYSSIP
jgi:hypothetical protein